MKSSLILTAVLFLAVVSIFGQTRVVRFEDAKTVSFSDRARFDNAVRAMDNSPVASHFAMVRTGGAPGDDVATGIMGVVHTMISQGSLVGLRVRRLDGTTQLEGVSQWNRDLMPGEGFVVKNPGGALFFSNTKQYEMIVVDSNTLTTTMDYISIVTGNGPFVNNAQVGTFAGNTVLRLSLVSSGANVDAVVINGNVVPRNLLAWDSTTGGTFLVDLTKLGVCFGGGDISVTVTMGGQSDTTAFRYPQGLTQTCGGSTSGPKG